MIENILRLPYVSAKDANKMPDKPGIYYFVLNNKVLYIGKSFSLNNRVACHRLLLKLQPEIAVHYEFIEKKNLFNVENRAIRKYRPELNEKPSVGTNCDEASLNNTNIEIQVKLKQLGKTQEYLSKKFNRKKSQISMAIKTEKYPTLKNKIISHLEKISR